MSSYTLTFTALPENLMVVRLTVSGVCARMGMCVDEIEDAKTAVGEGCLLVMHESRCKNITLEIDGSEGFAVRIIGIGEGVCALPQDFDPEFSLMLLGALCDSLMHEAGRVTFRMGK